MKNKNWLNVLLAVLVAGLFFTVSCSKQAAVTSETSVKSAPTN